MEFKGTKEPWITEYRNGNQYIYIVNEQKHFIGQMFYLGIERSNEDKYNALLISKALEMLEMLQDILETQDNGEVYHSYKIEQLIKEATEL